jgi:hypothetical protein
MSKSVLLSHNLAASGHLSGGAALIFFGVIFIISIFYIFTIWKVFTKAGQAGWKAIIPIYNTWTLFEIAGKPGWWALLVLLFVIPYVGLLFGLGYVVLNIIAALELAKRFGKSQTFAVLGLVIFSFVGYPILAFGDAKYNAIPPNQDFPSQPFQSNPGAPVAPSPPTSPVPPAPPPPEQPFAPDSQPPESPHKR